MPARKFNEVLIKSGLICPPGKSRVEYTDVARTGLYIEVRATSSGQGTYYYRYKDSTGKTRHTKIGRTTDISLKEAKTKLKELRARVHLGADPSAEARAQKQSMTWEDFFEKRYLPHVKQHKRSWKNDEEMQRLRVNPRFGSLRLNQINKQQVQVFHAELKDEGLAPATADHHLKLIRQALNLAVEWSLLKSNPAARVKLFREDNQRERYLDATELQRLLAVLDTDKNRTVCNAVKFLLSTGARLNEALTAKWSDIDRGNRVWVIQATNSKSKRKRSVPLNDVAIGVLDKLRTEGKSSHLFTNSRTGNRLTTISKVWIRIRKAAGLPDLRLHDLRHSYASMLVNSGRSLYEVQQILGHSDPTVTQRYAHLSSTALQEAANAASDQMTAATNIGS